MGMESLCRYLDHAVLKPEYNREQAVAEIRAGIEHDVKSVCVRPIDIEVAKELTAGTNTEVSCVLAFPHGSARSDTKAAEARCYVELGVDEIDMVVSYGLIRSAAWDAVTADIHAVTSVANPAGVGVKVILETCLLDQEQIAAATRCAITANAAFVKTSTGFAGGGASVEAVGAMIKAAAGKIEVKASGGIRDRETADNYLAMGVTRLGVGSSTTPLLCGGGGRSDADY